jgi:hypothetical protein
VARAADWLAQFVDPSSGQAPNHGANDGALVLPLSDAEFGDFRPVVQLARAVASGCRTYDPGHWDEPLAWLGIEAGALRSVPLQAPTPSSGYFLLHGEQSRALVRCARYDSRPSHADQLHVDLWIDGDNVACDAGTYLYTAAPPWDNALASTAVHNTVTVDGRDQMTRVGRFLWAHWAQGRVAQFDAGPRAACFAGEHDGYRALGVTHRRAVWNCGRTWFVVDDVVGLGRHRCRLHWLLPDGSEVGLHEADGTVRLAVGSVLFRVASSRPFAWSLVRGGSAEEPTRGWRSRHYGDLERARSLAVVVDLALPVRFVTSFAPAAELVEIDTARVRAGNTVVELAGIGDVPIRRQSVGAHEAAAERPRASSR